MRASIGWAGLVVVGAWATLGVWGGTLRVAPYLQNTTSNVVTVIWETTTRARGEVECRPAVPGNGSARRAADREPVRLHRLRLEGLAPDTRYRYRVSHAEAPGWTEFQTAPISERPIRFAVIGDSRFWRESWEQSRLPEHLEANRPEFALHMGDLVNKGHDYSLWPSHFRRFQSLGARMPMFPLRGNHEGDSKKPEEDWFAYYYRLPGGEPYSAFDWGLAHFALVSYLNVGGAADAKTVQFLDRDLGSSDRPWKLVAFHFPVYCCGYRSVDGKRAEAGRPAYEKVFDRHHVAMHMAGHTHIYERSYPYAGGKRDDAAGTVYLVQGGNVGGHYRAPWSALVCTNMDMPHYSLVEIGPDGLELRSFGLAPGTRARGRAAPIVEFDHYIQWRNEAVPRVALAWFDAADGLGRLEPIERLGALRYAPAAARLVPLLDDPDPRIREAAGLALERIADPASVSRLLPCLRHADAAVRLHVARALECALPSNLVPAVAPLIADPSVDAAVRAVLLGAVRYSAPTEAYAVARQVLRTRETVVRGLDDVRRNRYVGGRSFAPARRWCGSARRTSSGPRPRASPCPNWSSSTWRKCVRSWRVAWPPG